MADPERLIIDGVRNVIPRFGLKYFRLGLANRDGTGTTNRIPSIAATRPPPSAWAKPMPACRAIRCGLAAV